jgi:hypothetical protein
MTTSSCKSLTLVSDLTSYSGYGNTAQHMAIEFARIGYEISLIPMYLDEYNLAPEVANMLADSPHVLRSPVLYYGWPKPAIRVLRRYDHLINTMCESSSLPAQYVRLLHGAFRVIVPSTFCRDVFKSSGVRAPIAVVPEAIRVETFPFLHRPRRSTFTGLVVGAVERRKHLEETVTAWTTAFPGDGDARLHVKVSRGDLSRVSGMSTDQVVGPA